MVPVRYRRINKTIASHKKFLGSFSELVLNELLLNIQDDNFSLLFFYGFSSRRGFQHLINLMTQIDCCFFHGDAIYFEIRGNYVKYHREKYGDVFLKIALLNTPIIAGVSICENWLYRWLEERSVPLTFDVTNMHCESDVLRLSCVNSVRVENYNVRLAKILSEFPRINRVEMTVLGDFYTMPKVKTLIVNLRNAKNVPEEVLNNGNLDLTDYESYHPLSQNCPIIPTLPSNRKPRDEERNESLLPDVYDGRRTQFFRKLSPVTKRLIIRDHYTDAEYSKIGRPKMCLQPYLTFFVFRMDYVELDLLLRCDTRKTQQNRLMAIILQNLFTFRSQVEMIERRLAVKEYKIKVQYFYLIKRCFFNDNIYLMKLTSKLSQEKFDVVKRSANSLTFKTSVFNFAECYFTVYKDSEGYIES